MFESLTDKLERAFKVLKGQGQVTEINIAETIKEIRRALIDADVNYKIAKEFTDEVRQKALGANVLKALSPSQVLVKTTHDELVRLMGGEAENVNLTGNPAVILIAGLQGSGKTTFCGKLGYYLKTRKSGRPLLVACDIYRPAAIDQLEITGKTAEIPVYSERENKNPVDIARKAIEFARSQDFNMVIIDTAGRMHVDEEMMKEIEEIKRSAKPAETLFVVDAMTGQDAVNTARVFNERIDFDGVVLTKLDGDTRGGAALSIRAEVHKPIKFIGTGEKYDSLDLFYPDRMATRILGMGDIVTFVEKVQEQYDEEEAKKLHKKFIKNQFTFNDFYSQIQQIKKMGNLKDMMGMIPGMGKMIKNFDFDEKVFMRTEAIIMSMTPAERENPSLISGSRRKRIAAGSGSTVEDVNRLLKQFDEMRKMMKMVTTGGPALQNMMRRMPQK
ncbi:MAG: signal recognition particle protein [Bacteroidetes bacterium]|nr:signal recognition particle protein [Bacteroidota bacterium]